VIVTRLLGAVALALVTAVAVAGCGADVPPTEPAAPVDAEGSWELVDGVLDGVPIPAIDGARTTFLVSGSSVGGTAACNHYGGEVVVRGGAVTFGELSMTAMGCDEPLMEAEAAYMAALGAIEGARMDGDDLVLFGRTAELRFRRLAPPPTEALVGTEWVLESLIRGAVASSVAGDRATLVLRPDGSASGSTGCRTFDGRYVTVGDEIQMTELRMDGDCPATLEGQDRHVVSVIGDGFTVEIDGEVLTLGSRGGIGAVYRATPE
jgi:heat shock protein HslJ